MLSGCLRIFPESQTPIVKYFILIKVLFHFGNFDREQPIIIFLLLLKSVLFSVSIEVTVLFAMAMQPNSVCVGVLDYVVIQDHWVTPQRYECLFNKPRSCGIHHAIKINADFDGPIIFYRIFDPVVCKICVE